eukprot:scaffold2132_cov66-Cyclotella_meneghiniana.AAC.4
MAPQHSPRSYNNMIKNVFLLSGMWGLGLGAAFVQIPSASLLLIQNGYDSISTVPLGLIMLLPSPCAVLIPKLITAFGEKKIFIVASILGVVGSQLQMSAVLTSQGAVELTLILIGASVQSLTYASSNNLRFAVAYFTKDHPDFLPKGTSFVPPSKNRESDELDETLDMLLIGAEDERNENTQNKSLIEFLKQTDLALLTLFQCLSYNVMALYMGQVQFPLLDGGFSSNEVTYTITSHMIGMFLPGLFSGHVVNYIGTWATTFIGFTIFVAAGILFMLYNSLAMIILGMTTIGLGWNFSFVGPSSDVSKIYNDA